MVEAGWTMRFDVSPGVFAIEPANEIAARGGPHVSLCGARIHAATTCIPRLAFLPWHLAATSSSLRFSRERTSQGREWARKAHPSMLIHDPDRRSTAMTLLVKLVNTGCAASYRAIMKKMLNGRARRENGRNKLWKLMKLQTANIINRILLR